MKKFFELKSRGYRNGVKRRDKIGMGYELLHVMGLLSVQWLQVDDVIPILSPAVTVVLVGVALKDSFGGTCIKFIQVVVFSKATL